MYKEKEKKSTNQIKTINKNSKRIMKAVLPIEISIKYKIKILIKEKHWNRKYRELNILNIIRNKLKFSKWNYQKTNQKFHSNSCKKKKKNYYPLSFQKVLK